MFSDIFNQNSWLEVKEQIYACTEQDVLAALQKSKRNIGDFKALISPAAAPYLGYMAERSHKITVERFGKTVQMFAPLYLSNECQNICTYCAFSLDNKIRRRTLNDVEILQEAAVLKAAGFEHVLLVTGEASQSVGIPYLKNAIHILRPLFSNISLEVQPLEEEDYRLLIEEGLHAVLVYQETYHKDNYKIYHPKGKKSNFHYRLETPDRLGRAGIHKIGLGTLIGLEDWRTDCFFTALHINYLQQRYWQTKYTVSFPRLRPIERRQGSGHILKQFDTYMTDRELVQLICAYRIWNPQLELSISTREEERFRDHIIKLGITSMSAGSRTNPGGYTVEQYSLEQFEISDERTPADVADMIRRQGYEVVWKDWEKSF